MNENQLRDRLAVERTRLANERTMLAYTRTALGLAAAGAALLHFFAAQACLAWMLIWAGGLLLLFGAYRFATVRRQLRTGL
jgi:putative membrane protein